MWTAVVSLKGLYFSRFRSKTFFGVTGSPVIASLDPSHALSASVDSDPMDTNRETGPLIAQTTTVRIAATPPGAKPQSPASVTSSKVN